MQPSLTQAPSHAQDNAARAYAPARAFGSDFVATSACSLSIVCSSSLSLPGTSPEGMFTVGTGIDACAQRHSIHRVAAAVASSMPSRRFFSPSHARICMGRRRGRASVACRCQPISQYQLAGHPVYCCLVSLLGLLLVMCCGARLCLPNGPHNHIQGRVASRGVPTL